MDMPVPWIESDRLSALQDYGILDTHTGGVFDDFVQIAAQVCGAPISVVNLIDETRQWFAAEIGLGIRETPLDVSICAHAILQPDVLVVPDLTEDPRFNGNPLVAGTPNLRFYAGALLETPTGLPLGTMCVLDTAPRPQGLTAHQTFTLRALARQVMAQLELRRALAEKQLLVLEAHHRVKNSLTMVRALLNLQARTTTHGEAARQLRESAGRIVTIGAMHEHLYRAGATREVNLAAYLRSLLTDQSEALVSTLPERSVAFVADDMHWPTSDAAAIGLIMMELVTNALKYGEGRVTVALCRAGDAVELSVEDEGEALPADYEPSDSKGLGMKILTGLLRGQGGRLTIDRGSARTRFVVRLPAAARDI